MDPVDTGLLSDQPPVVAGIVEGVARIELNRPEAGNALDLGLVAGLREALEHAAQDPAVRVVALTSRGRLFCGGGDVAAMAAAPDRPAFLAELAGAAHEAVLTLARLRKPVVCGVQGAAAGAGLGLTLVSDLVVAGESSSFVMAYGGIGVSPDCGTTYLLPRVVGLRRALEMGLRNVKVRAPQALDWGLVGEVVPDDEVQERTWQVAAALAAGPAAALGHTRALMRGALDLTAFAAHLADEAEGIAHFGGTAEADELIERFARR